MTEETTKNALIRAAVGAGLGQIFEGNKVLLALAGAAIGASLEGRENAKRLNSPIVYVDNGNLIKEFPDGRKEILKTMSTVAKQDLGKKFTI
ncbi:MAG: hypothetical protein ACI8UX_001362 [Psychromonas sp.]|jgi:hypothetical protein